MKIYTKTGDQGTTGLFAGPRVSKNHPRIAAYGSVDELNALLGVCVAQLPPELADVPLGEQTLSRLLTGLQSDLFAVGAELATPDPDARSMRLLPADRVAALEGLIDAADSQLPPLTNFILPGGHPLAAYLHYARTVCRRAERELVGLMQQPGIADYGRLLVYLNRLSDFLFVLARLVNHCSGQSEQTWQKE